MCGASAVPEPWRATTGFGDRVELGDAAGR